MADQSFPSRAQLFLAAVGQQALTYRETAGVGVEDVAAAVGMAPKLLDALERNHFDLTMSQLQAVAKPSGLPSLSCWT